MIDQLLGSFLALNEVREEPVIPGSCISAHAERRADQALTDFHHKGLPALLERCDFEWAGEIMIRSSGPIPMRKAVRAWLASPEHREVLLSPRAERVGIGRAVDVDTSVYVIVINFGE